MRVALTARTERLVEILRSAPRLDAKAHTPPRSNDNHNKSSRARLAFTSRHTRADSLEARNQSLEALNVDALVCM